MVEKYTRNKHYRCILARLAEMIYDFYTIGLREGVKDVMYVGSANSFSIGLEIMLDKVTNKLPSPLHGLSLGLTVSKGIESLQNDDYFLVHITTLGKHWYTGVHYHKENTKTLMDYREVFLNMQATYKVPQLDY